MSADISNPLLEAFRLPPFSRIRPEHVEPAVDHRLADAREELEALLHDRNRTFSWTGLVEPLQRLEDRLNKTWSPIGHLHAVADQPALRDAYNSSLQKLSEYTTEVGQNRRLYEGYRSIAEGREYRALTPAQCRVIDNALRDFRLAGVELSGHDRTRFKAIATRRAELGSRFQENVMDATQAWSKHLERESDLAGLPESTRRLAAQRAANEGLSGWQFGLDHPTYAALITYADDEALRRDIYEAHATRASDAGPFAGRWDNGDTIEEITALRHEQARLLGFGNYAQASLAQKMAPSIDRVMAFLGELTRRARPFAQRELAALEHFARTRYGKHRLQAWDIAYYAEKLKTDRYAFSQETLRPYFPLSRVLGGLFEIVRRLYGLEIEAAEEVDAWHPDVQFFRITDSRGVLRGEFYLDAFARPGKRGGAWMDQCVSRQWISDQRQTPVAYLTCNFTPPGQDAPALLTHDEVATLFHEFGHGLQHLLTTVDYPSIAGINGVEWDAVELPSQFMENWCWEREALGLISRHIDTGETLADKLVEQLRAAKHFHAGMQTVRQLEFALFDFRLHLEYQPSRGAQVQALLDDVRRHVAVVIPPSFNRFAHAFTHVFGGGGSYAAGYYSYKWAETLSSDAFAQFEEDGIFNAETGRRFMRCILEPGGSRDAMELFVAFRGREPTLDALLRRSGLLEDSVCEGIA